MNVLAPTLPRQMRPDRPRRYRVRDRLKARVLTGALDRALADGTWSRLKLCANPDCDWAFYDRSRNRQGAWCTMEVCGNRLKNRRFRARAR